MKKKIIILMAIGCCLCFTACAPSTSESEETFDFDFLTAMGLTQEEAYSKLNISEDSLEKAPESLGQYYMKEPVSILGIDFKEYLLIWEKDDGSTILYGGGYQHITENDNKLSKKVRETKAELERLYGDPITDPNQSHVLGDKTDFSQYTEYSALVEGWQAKDENCDLALTIAFTEENVLIDVRYQMKVGTYNQ